ncbi:uracil-DNA glycosylase family protein [Arenivirga flava]|uniref:Uracil-DNA glycosylase n=1 Tax=Arenivirga flava TaxID=1930060 RepID=A0AA37XA71_9MICO|nr:uracil-DNA glycosylase family protein [Arenivirga flava]GMA29504.1 uracil-DNA glycosylase [Arenivirga flava]
MTTLDELRAEIAAHESNAWATARGWKPLVIGESTARILILSQAPGRLAQESGIAFDDPSGRLLRSWMDVTDAEFWDPAKVAILPMDAYFPGSRGAPSGPGARARPDVVTGTGAESGTPAPARGGGDLPPRPDFADRWHPRVLQQLPEVRLRLVIGAHAQRRYLGPGSVTEHVRDAEAFLPFFPLVHPSPLARGWRTANPWFAHSTVPLLRRLVRRALD